MYNISYYDKGSTRKLFRVCGCLLGFVVLTLITATGQPQNKSDFYEYYTVTKKKCFDTLYFIKMHQLQQSMDNTPGNLIEF